MKEWISHFSFKNFNRNGQHQIKIKTGMGGSSSGKNRSDKTEDLKVETKKRRRLEGKVESTIDDTQQL